MTASTRKGGKFALAYLRGAFIGELMVTISDHVTIFRRIAIHGDGFVEDLFLGVGLALGSTGLFFMWMQLASRASRSEVHQPITRHGKSATATRLVSFMGTSSILLSDVGSLLIARLWRDPQLGVMSYWVLFAGFPLVAVLMMRHAFSDARAA